MPSILFVCLGNICRSPAAEGVMLHQLKDSGLDVHVESCGLGDWHKGKLPDPRMREASKLRGIVLTSRAQAFRQEFFDQFDYILAADQSVMNQLHEWGTIPEHKAKIHLITQFSPLFSEKEVPDPYYADQAQFVYVLDMLEDACKGLVEHLSKTQ